MTVAKRGAKRMSRYEEAQKRALAQFAPLETDDPPPRIREPGAAAKVRIQMGTRRRATMPRV